jgi:ribosome biogenesis GTPase A
LDTPGVLWPKFEDREVGYRLAATGAVKDEVLDVAEVAVYALRLLQERYMSPLLQRYRLSVPAEDPWEWLEAIGRQRGCLMGGGEVDLEKAAAVFLQDLRTGKIGRISLEWPPAAASD